MVSSNMLLLNVIYSSPKYSKPLIKGPKAGEQAIVMDASYKGKLLAFAVSAALLLSSLVFLTGVQAGPAEDLGIENVSETLGSPPPRKNVAYDLDVTWENEGSSDYDATIRLYDDCDESSVVTESDTITMGAGESGTVTLEYTFTDEGEVCF